MIEFCTKKRMVVSIVLLGLLTVIVLILEEKLTSVVVNPTPTSVSNAVNIGSLSSSKSVVQDSNNSALEKPLNKASCWTREKFTVVQECHRCTEFEVNSKTPAACADVGLKETLKCEETGVVYRTCKSIKGLQKVGFWIFESCTLLVAVLSWGLVRHRTGLLDRKSIRQVERRLAAGL